MGRRRGTAFVKYRDAVLTADGIDSGEIPWQDYAPYTCGDRKQQAWWDAFGDVDACMRVLLGGHAPRRGHRTTRKRGPDEDR